MKYLLLLLLTLVAYFVLIPQKITTSSSLDSKTLMEYHWERAKQLEKSLELYQLEASGR